MAARSHSPALLTFGPFEANAQAGELRKNGVRIRLSGQPLRILFILLEQRGEVVTREQLREHIWNSETFVDFEGGLNAAMNKLRRALNDSAEKPRYVETLTGRGYRFIAPVEFASADGAPPTPEHPLDSREVVSTVPASTSPASRPIGLSAILRVLAVVIPVLVAFGIWQQHRMKQQAELERLEFQGNFFVMRWNEADIRKGIEYYKRAIALNPASASAYVGLAWGWNFLSDLHSSPHEVMPRSKAAALKAIRLDDSLASAHIVLGVVKMQYDWDWPGSEREFRRAIELDPAKGSGHENYGWLLIALGRFKKAQEELRRSLETDPLDEFNLVELGLSYYFARQYEPAVEQCRQSIGVDPTLYWSHMLLGWSLEQQGALPAAIDELSQASRLIDTPQVMAALGHAYAASGRRAEAQQVIGELRESSKRRYVSPYDIATIYAGLGDKEQTLMWLGKAYEDRSGWLALWLKVDPKFDALRSDPRFHNLLRNIGLSP